MCYGMHCGREEASGTCRNPQDCIMTALEREEEERFFSAREHDDALKREHFLCPNCLEQGERTELTYDDGLFTCPECGGVCKESELIELYEDIRAGEFADASAVRNWIEKLDGRIAA